MYRYPRFFLLCILLYGCLNSICIAQTVTYTSPFIIQSLATRGNELWIGSYGGITYIDLLTGNKKVYTTASTTMKSHNIDGVFIDKDGHKWACTSQVANCIYKFDGLNWIEKYQFFPGGAGGTTVRFRQDPLNRVVVLNNVDPLNLIYFDDTSTFSFSISQLTKAYDFDFDSLGHLWVAGINGIAYYDSINWTVYYPQYNFSKIAVDKKGIVWATWSDYPDYRVFRFDGTSWTIDSSANAQIAGGGDIHIDDNNNKIFYGYNNPVLVYNDTAWSTFQGNWCIDSAYVFEMDSAGAVYSAGNWKVDTINFFSNNSCSSIYCTDFSFLTNYFETVDFGPDNKIYAATYMGGIFEFNGISVAKIPTPVMSNSFRKIRFDHNGNLWVISDYTTGINSCLAKWDGSLWTVYPFLYDFHDMDFAPNGDIWFGTEQGLLKYDGVNFTNIPFNAPTTSNPTVYSVAVDTSGNVWISVYGSIGTYNGSSFTWITSFSGSADLLRSDKKGNVFMNSQPFGTLMKYDGSTFIPINSGNSTWPIGAGFSSLREDISGNLWFGTNRGLVKYDGMDYYLFENISYQMGNYTTYDLAIDNIGNVWCANHYNLSVVNLHDNGQFEIEPKNQVSGMEFIDANNNGLFDSTDTGIPYHKIVLNPGNICHFTNYLGNYNLYTDSVDCEVFYQSVPGYTLTTDSVLFHIHADSIYNCCYDFGIHPDSVIHHAEILMFSSNIPCNRPANLWLNITNMGTVTDNFTAWLKCDSNLSFNSSNIPPVAFSGDTIFWNIGNLPPFGIAQLVVNVSLINSQLAPGTLLEMISGVTDAAPSLVYNSDTLTAQVRCSFDPNEKKMEPLGDTIFHAVPVAEWIDYTINFQNVGNDTAISVFIYDTLDSHLDINTFTFVASSHHPSIKYDNQGCARFAFYNIMLPDSQVNYTASQGFISYRIKPKANTPDSTRIENKAHIYFDFNNPVRTNTVFNTILSPATGILPLQKPLDAINVYPNPLFQKELHIDFSFYPVGKPELRISDLSGRKIYSIALAKSKRHNITLPELDAGIYNITVIDGNNRYNKKLVIINP